MVNSDRLSANQCVLKWCICFWCFEVEAEDAFKDMSVLVFLQLCKAGLKTLQDLGPEMRLALNEDLEEEAMMEEEEEDNIVDKVHVEPSTAEGWVNAMEG